MKKLSLAVVGGGPAGFYLARQLSKLPKQPLVHIFEKEYCPFGLIRYGVAPDHISIKKSETTLASIHSYQGFKYYGNQGIDQGLLRQLRRQYSGVVYAFGAQSNNEPPWFSDGRSKHSKDGNILNARDLVYWYNNHPQYETYRIDLNNTRNAVIVGNGNVAIDISRILLRLPEELAKTQISSNALESLRESKVRNVFLVGRRGFTHSAFALKEIREVVKFKIKIYCIEEQLKASMNESSYIECTSLGNHNAAVVRMNKRKVDFLKDKCQIIKKAELDSVLAKDQKKLILRYLLDPQAITDGSHIKFGVTELKGEPFQQTAHRTGRQEILPFDLLVNSTGFKVDSIVPSQLDRRNNQILNSNGCVLIGDDPDKVNLGQYAVGWCKSGPKGVIDQTLLGSEQTFNNIRIHINNRVIEQKPVPSFSTSTNVSFERYLQLREVQLSRGDKQNFIKKKLSLSQIRQFFK